MHVLIYVPLLVPVLAAVCARPLAERLPPRTATWLLTVSAVALAAASGAALGLLAMAAAMRLPVIDSLGGMSLAAVLRLDPAPLPLGVVAGAFFLTAALAAVRAAWLRTAALIAVRRQARWLSGDGQVAVVQDDSADAYALPGPRGRIVITTGMLAALSEAECGVLLAHERAHAAGRHYLFTALARLSAAANPLLRPMAAAISYSVERWADEQAAVVSGSRLLAARTIAKAALAAAGAPPVRMTTAGALAAVPSRAELRKAGSVPRRVDALLCPPPPRQIMLLLLAIALVAAAGLAACHAAGDLHAMVEFAQAAAVS
jgi:Zn-dependent protease with chaperone function